MANTAPKVAPKERQEGPDVVERRAEALVRLIKKSKHFIAFTGAGVSTAAGIPDFRGPEGAWTLRAQGKEVKAGVDTLEAIPTASHMALAELQRRGILKYLISQNCDGLHRRSGIKATGISELHGNSNREYCKDCGKEYIRDFRAVAPYDQSLHDHRTGRTCAACGGILLDTIIHFGEELFEEPLKHAEDHAEKADLCLVLGSSLTVMPACDVPARVGQRKNAVLAICNLQETPKDSLAGLRIFSRADDLMIRVMQKLDIQIPVFILRRNLVVEMETNQDERQQLTVKGVDPDGTPNTFLRSVKSVYNRRVARSEPFTIGFRSSVDAGTELNLELEFMGHYAEPKLELTYRFTPAGGSKVFYLLEYNPYSREWTTTELGEVGENAASDMAKSDKVVIDLTGDDSMLNDSVRELSIFQ
ncbi:NAD-dependent deacetylase sirtuin-7 [Xylariaceae sp. FL0804]|nr:NAD-dependent deacetylase sirtuin-7 [Xylariaceae sp. FL0804]